MRWARASGSTWTMTGTSWPKAAEWSDAAASAIAIAGVADGHGRVRHGLDVGRAARLLVGDRRHADRRRDGDFALAEVGVARSGAWRRPDRGVSPERSTRTRVDAGQDRGCCRCWRSRTPRPRRGTSAATAPIANATANPTTARGRAGRAKACDPGTLRPRDAGAAESWLLDGAARQWPAGIRLRGRRRLASGWSTRFEGGRERSPCSAPLARTGRASPWSFRILFYRAGRRIGAACNLRHGQSDRDSAAGRAIDASRRDASLRRLPKSLSRSGRSVTLQRVIGTSRPPAPAVPTAGELPSSDVARQHHHAAVRLLADRLGGDAIVIAQREVDPAPLEGGHRLELEHLAGLA